MPTRKPLPDLSRRKALRPKDEDTPKQWHNHVQHLVAQRVGLEKWYHYYKLEVATVTRSNNFERGQVPDRDRA